MATENIISQETVEVANAGSSAQRVSQLGVEVATATGSASTAVSQLDVEVANSGLSEQRVSQLCIEMAYIAGIGSITIEPGTLWELDRFDFRYRREETA